VTDDTVEALTAAVEACDTARSSLEDALDSAEAAGGKDEDHLRAVATALENWRDSQRHFMKTVDQSEASDVATAAMLLKMNHGIDSTNARRGLPGVHVDGTDQPFDLDTSGTRGTVLTTAAMEYVTPPDA
jgi:hypothetical protein